MSSWIPGWVSVQPQVPATTDPVTTDAGPEKPLEAKNKPATDMVSPPATIATRAGALAVTTGVCAVVAAHQSQNILKTLFVLRSTSMWRRLCTVLHLFSFASWFGCAMWVSFVAGLTMFMNMRRHEFGRLQARLFPRYFQFSFIMVAASLFFLTAEFFLALPAGTSLAASAVSVLGSLLDSSALIHLTILAIQLGNALWIEPVARVVMAQRHGIEREIGTGHEIGKLGPVDPEIIKKYNAHPGLPALNKRFTVLHGVSTSINMVGLCLGLVYIWRVSGAVEISLAR